MIRDGYIDVFLEGCSDRCHDLRGSKCPDARLGRRSSYCAVPNHGARQTDLVVDHLLVLVALFQGRAKLYNIRVLRVVVPDKRATHGDSRVITMTYICVELIASPIKAQYESARRGDKRVVVGFGNHAARWGRFACTVRVFHLGEEIKNTKS